MQKSTECVNHHCIRINNPEKTSIEKVEPLGVLTAFSGAILIIVGFCYFASSMHNPVTPDEDAPLPEENSEKTTDVFKNNKS